jgi:hypothetical protein
MTSPTFLRASFAALIAMLLPLAQGDLFAQQPWAQYLQYSQPGYVQPSYSQPGYVQPGYSQPSYAQPNPYASQYAPNPQPAYSQPGYGQYGYAQPQPYAQQPYPSPTPEYAPAYPQQPYPQPDYSQTQPQQQPFNPDQLEQLVAPIALYPDALMAQILAAATYPAQVVAADHWLQSQPWASPDQIAAGADAQTNWDPSMKALTAFPQVLAMMDRDLQWTTDLGNAYYNQPQDVLQTVQVMRQRAENAGTLENTPQEAVIYDQGYIELAPPNPQIVYVPAYNPWAVYGQPVSPYPGFSLIGAIGSVLGTGLRYGGGIAMAAFSHTPFGWAGWALNWLTQSIFFNHSNYTSHSTSVAHWGGSRNGMSGFSRAGPSGLQGSYNRSQAYGRSQENYSREGNYSQARPSEAPYRAYIAPQNNYARPAPQTYENRSYDNRTFAYNRQPQIAIPARQQPYSAYTRPGGSSFYSSPRPEYAVRPAAPYAAARRNDFSQRAYSGDRAYAAPYGRGFAESASKPEHSGGFHLFGGHHESEKSFGGGKAPKFSGGEKHSGGGHHGGSGHHR